MRLNNNYTGEVVINVPDVEEARKIIDKWANEGHGFIYDDVEISGADRDEVMKVYAFDPKSLIECKRCSHLPFNCECTPEQLRLTDEKFDLARIFRKRNRILNHQEQLCHEDVDLWCAPSECHGDVSKSFYKARNKLLSALGLTVDDINYICRYIIMIEIYHMELDEFSYPPALYDFMLH